MRHMDKILKKTKSEALVASKHPTQSPSSEGVNVAVATNPTNTSNNSYSILLTREELASRWQYHVETLKKWEVAGKLPFLQLGNQIRYRLSVIEEIEKNSEVHAL